MRFMGIDYGTKRVGIALSDEDGRLAFPHTILKNSPKLLEDIKKIGDKEDVKTVIIGESLDYKGEKNQIMEGVESLKEKLEKEEFKVFLEPEVLSSVEARRSAKPGANVDASAAALILQSFLDKNKT